MGKRSPKGLVISPLSRCIPHVREQYASAKFHSLLNPLTKYSTLRINISHNPLDVSVNFDPSEAKTYISKKIAG
jgi:hypothetical protein